MLPLFYIIEYYHVKCMKFQAHFNAYSMLRHGMNIYVGICDLNNLISALEALHRYIRRTLLNTRSSQRLSNSVSIFYVRARSQTFIMWIATWIAEDQYLLRTTCIADHTRARARVHRPVYIYIRCCGDDVREAASCSDRSGCVLASPTPWWATERMRILRASAAASPRSTVIWLICRLPESRYVRRRHAYWWMTDHRGHRRVASPNTRTTHREQHVLPMTYVRPSMMHWPFSETEATQVCIPVYSLMSFLHTLSSTVGLSINQSRSNRMRPRSLNDDYYLGVRVVVRSHTTISPCVVWKER